MVASRRRPGQRFGALVAAVLAAGALACGKTTESLVVVSLTSATPVASPGPVTVTVGGTTRTFTVASLSSTPTSVGVYVPESVTGTVAVSVEVAAQSCAGWSGTGSANIPAAGASVGAAVPLTAALACTCREFDHRAAGAPACDLSATPHIADAYITGTAFSPDGRHFATAGDDGRIKVWRFDGTTLSPEAEIPLDGGGKVAFSPDGRLIAAASWSGAGNPVAVYDVPAFTLHQTLNGATDFTIDVGFTPDGQHVIVLEADGLGSGALLSFSLVSGHVTAGAIGDLDPITLAVSRVAGAGIPIAVSSSDGRAGVVNFAQDGFSAPMVFDVTSDGSTTWAVAFSPDGTLLAAGGEDAAFDFWQQPFTSTTPTGAPLAVGGGSGINGLAFSPDGKYIAVAAGTIGREVSFWSVAAGAKLASYVPSYVPASVAYAPDGGAIAGGELYCGKVFLCTHE